MARPEFSQAAFSSNSKVVKHKDVPQRPIASTMQGIIVDRVAIVCHNLLPS